MPRLMLNSRWVDLPAAADTSLLDFLRQDRGLTAAKPAELWWFLHTEAKVSLSDGNRTATLSQNGKTFTVRLEEPKEGAFTVMDCMPLPSSPSPEKQASNSKRRKLALQVKDVQSARIQVSLEPAQRR